MSKQCINQKKKQLLRQLKFKNAQLQHKELTKNSVKTTEIIKKNISQKHTEHLKMNTCYKEKSRWENKYSKNYLIWNNFINIKRYSKSGTAIS